MSEQLGYRAFAVKAAKDGETSPRGILTTEQPVEMLSYDPESATYEYVPEVLLMSGMKARGKSIKLLDTHNTDSVRNVLGSFVNLKTHPAGERDVPHAFVDGEIKISSTEADIATKVAEQHINEMSVGYRYSEDKTIRVPEGETMEINGKEYPGGTVIRTEWYAQEASLVPLGADDQAQIRGFKDAADARAKISRISRKQTEAESTSEGMTPAAGQGDDKPAAETEESKALDSKLKQNSTLKKSSSMENNEIDNGKVEEQARQAGVKAGEEAFDKRADAIMAIGEQVEDANWAISQLRSGASVEDVQAAAIKKLKEATANPGHKTEGDVGLSKKEKKGYSLSKAMLALAEGRKPEGLEAEVSGFISDRCDRRPDGFFVAPEALRSNGQRDLLAGTATDGDELVENELRSGDFIDVLRPNMVSAQAGIRILSGLVGDVNIPRKTSASSAAWKGEVVTFTESEPQFETLTLSPNHLGCFTDVSKQLLHQGLPDVDALVRDDLNSAIAVALDKAVFQGSGSGEPQGIDGATGVPTSTSGTDAAPVKAELFEYLEDIDTGNALAGKLAWVTTPALASYLKQTQIDSSTGNYFWDTANDTVLGYSAYSTSQCDTHDIFFGNWDDYIMGIFDGIDITVDPFTGAKTRLITYVVNVMADGDVRRAASFCTNA